jgi:ankyrin repeat protein
MQMLRRAEASPTDLVEVNLLNAAKDAAAERITRLVRIGANPNARGYYNRSALRYAVEFGHLDVVEALLQAGADVTTRNGQEGLTRSGPQRAS